MYKRTISIMYIIVLLGIFLQFVYAEPPPGDQPLSDVINKVMQNTAKDVTEEVNRNMNENFVQLDNRIMDKLVVIFRKAIFALLGGLTVVIFGYAYVVNRISRNYDMNFYEKMIDSKINNMKNLPYITHTSDSFYSSVTKHQFDDRYISPQKYFDRFTKTDEARTESSGFYGSVYGNDVDMSRYAQEPKKTKSKLSGILYIIITIVVIVVAYILLRKYANFSMINLFHTAKVAVK